MLNLLLKLWLIQQRRSFSWKNALVAVYFLVILISVGIAIYIENGRFLSNWAHRMGYGRIAIWAIAGSIYVDYFSKWIFKQESISMDDFLLTKPISPSTWSRFLLVSNAFSFWTLSLPFLWGLCFVAILPLSLVPFALIMAFSAALLNSMILTGYHKMSSLSNRILLLIGILALPVCSFAIAQFTSNLSPFLSLAFYTLFNILLLLLLCCLITHTHSYNNYSTKAKRIHSQKSISLFSLEIVAILRTNRLKQMVFTLCIIAVIETYLLAFSDDSGNKNGEAWWPLLAICGPSATLGQWVFGMEGNYFHGLWTKPITIYRLLATKYRFLATLNALASLTLIPLVVLGKIPFFSWISLLVFAAGCINLVCLPTCLFSSRLDLFTSAFFNYQGANKFINFYSLIVLLPIGIWSFIDYFTSPLISDIVALTAGLIGLLIHPLLLRQLATVYIARRHKRFEAYNQ